MRMFKSKATLDELQQAMAQLKGETQRLHADQDEIIKAINGLKELEATVKQLQTDVANLKGRNQILRKMLAEYVQDTEKLMRF